MNKARSIPDIFRWIKSRYGIVLTTMSALCLMSFRAGMYFEKVIKEREITEIENRHSMELLEQKEKYMEKYFDLREKSLNTSK